MEGRIIAIRVSDADFELLDGLKRMKGIGWNQLLLVPVETAYGVTLESAQPGKPAKTKEPPSAEEAERVEVEGEGTLIMPHKHKAKGKKAGDLATQEEPAAEVEAVE